MLIPEGALIGFAAWFFVRFILTGFFTVDPNERAVKTVFGRARRLGAATTLDTALADLMSPDERQRYVYPQVRVIGSGGPYFKWPWERVFKVSVATETINMAKDFDDPSANSNGTVLQAVTKDQLDTGLEGQIRYRVSDANLYAYLFGVKNPIGHVMAYFVSVVRERIADFEAPKPKPATGADRQGATEEMSAMAGISINDIRKHMGSLNETMEHECRSAEARYGVVLDASLITGIEPPGEVEPALAAINTAHNQVSSDISLAHARADQRIVESRRAVEIETLKAQTEVSPLVALAEQLTTLKQHGPDVLQTYMRNVRLGLYARAQHAIVPEKR
ncbi:MAG: SPFH domain-containing protein [Bradyrhizobium sp.]|uniref:SPFH domain-containing protein n=1 Tax=Bradyrhizobium sp. TaxID=376 RepID=UPI001DF5CC8D|nr:SPFH domain-containing protein [Bradyrhizobium sp.]MBV9565753.1 SPFH domain-containing protein [Bradyrhizobium sp.]